ncbi:TVP38/TMEM64 family protein [Fructilactobacillus cliffordii]|uniref:VTT domain-containing protein n=1 Tax=Fructilactobacillus cliffordii TaxID=2940299 RepID=A0A9Q8ZSP5_9LACO|nr:VTT domain-containing protein [Fructilactobacillus cliffordii]USS85865.1 VTT domain-containing protein [Fructilactobacillus cliffordii]USS88934.1 VTT domain-containing protein [Fructilactobacillus cliffordii]
MKLPRISRMDLIKIGATIIGILILLMIFKDYLPQIKMMFDPSKRPQAIHEIRQHGAFDALLLMVLLFIGTVVPGIPVMPIAILAGLCFGTLFGTLINAISIGLGNLVAIHLISLFKRDVQKEYKHNRFADHLKNSKNPLMALVVGYSIPAIPSYLVSLQAANDERRFGNQLVQVAACLGTIPLALIYALGGNSLLAGKWLELLIVVIILLLFFLGADRFLKYLAG